MFRGSIQNKFRDPTRSRKIKIGACIALAGLVVFAAFMWLPFGRTSVVTKEVLVQSLGPSIASSQYPIKTQIQVDRSVRDVVVEYTIDWRLQHASERVLRSYKPDYAALAAVDAETGKILSLVSYTREPKDLGNLALRATFPAASIFKVVTAAAALDRQKMLPDTIIPFNGRSHTLYKSAVEKTRHDRWTRYMTLREAFARSVNPVFGKIGMFQLGAEGLNEYAQRFGFNKIIAADVPVGIGKMLLPAEDAWAVAEVASGFTKDTTMSPLHGALIAATIVNDGRMMRPYLVQSVFSLEGDVIYQPQTEIPEEVIEESTAQKLKDLMRETVEAGTSRRAFRPLLSKKNWSEVEVGGKTGHLTGLDPKGSYDWFVGYAKVKGRRVAVAALTINEDKWRVKSSELAGLYFDEFIK